MGKFWETSQDVLNVLNSEKFLWPSANAG